jgi:immune inhibitor A
VTFSENASGGSPPYTFLWSFGDGSAGAPGGAVYHVYRFWGMFEANVTLTDSLGDSVTSSVNVTVTPAALVVTAQPSDPSVAVGGIVVLETSVLGGARPYTYAWAGLPSGCPTIGAENLSCQVTTPGAFTVSVSVTDSLGTVAHASFDLTVTGGPTPPPPDSSPVTLYLELIVVLAIVASVVGLLIGMRWRRHRSRR